ncbi:MAG: PD-(D/E)XK nuclease family protein [Desulfarculaceae bacterium]|nr:PD-(D/E)XK nuclease family protein [Desulfarculaceae bacterium]MCF8073487.1 PD-(D/E)XK nuclease family protein [Desulfarculaceae bacterium]MCF8100366.1 PD-(D/E)XK nuclease family protein [Desulfarculaceae bacterium]MCF8115898.1 PD-(D/E)XK nuclease family protein [Desulfarculaceae bacterium]
MSPRAEATVWPSGQAREQALHRAAASAPGGLLLGGELVYTFQGANALLPRLWAQVPGAHEPARPLAELAGPLLVQNILAEPSPGQPSLAGLSRGRRFPHRLWRLLVGLKAARLTPAHLRALQGPGGSRREALALMLESYLRALASRGLADEADMLDQVEARLAKGGGLPLIDSWQSLVVKQALWLRPAELRLLRMLAGRVPVRVEFALVPPRGQEDRGVFRLLAKTADALERGDSGIEVSWRDLQGEGGPLAEVALNAWDEAKSGAPNGGALELVRSPGAYAEVEALLGRARELADAGVPCSEMELVFPDLSLYGQMAEDVAARLGLPLSFRRPEPLAASPLAQSLMELLSLPQRGYPRVELARVWDSPYLGPALARVLQVPQPRDAARLLSEAGYVDGRETPARDWLQEARGRVRPSRQDRLHDLAQACGALTAWLAPLDQAQTLEDFASRIGQMLSLLEPAARLSQDAHDPEAAGVLARDLNAAAGLERALSGLHQAAVQVSGGERLSPGRLLALLRQALEQQDAGRGAGARGGVRVLRLEDAHGLEPAWLLAGGLSQEEFPARPPDLRLISGEERIALGRAAGLPVWRTEDEEFGGQEMRLLLLLGSAHQGAMLACAATDMGGGPRSPSLLLSRLAASLGREDDLAVPPGGVYGQTPPLQACPDERSLWASLARAALHPSVKEARDAALAQALLYEITRQAVLAKRWSSLAARSVVEERRARLEVLGEASRRELAGPFEGLLPDGPAHDLLQAILDQPARRRLSPTSLEQYAACPMAWFLGRVLGLAPEDEPAWDLAGRFEGEWVHAALAAFFTPRDFDPTWDAAQQAARLQDCLAQAGRDLADQGRAGHGLVQQARREVLLTALNQVVAEEMAALEGMRPLTVEAEFGREDDGLKIEVEQGEPLRLHGRLDRLDQGQGELRVVDYKHSLSPRAAKDPVRRNELAISAFQVPVYLAAARDLWGGPGDALSARLVPTRRRDSGPGLLSLEPDAPLLSEDAEVRRALAEEDAPNLFNAVAALWGRLSKGDYLATPEKATCGYCSLGGVCRSRLDPAAALEDAP